MCLPGLLPAQVPLADLAVEGPEIVKNTQPEKSNRHQVQQSRPPFAHVKSVNSEEAEEREQNPGDRIVDRPSNEAAISFPVHRRDQE